MSSYPDSSYTRGGIALDLFKDRHDHIRHFLGYLNDPQPPHKVLYFYGDGGNGKSLLLRYLKEHCCKHFAGEGNWEHIRTCPDAEFLVHVLEVEGANPVPSALIDFGANPQFEDRPQEAISALLMLQRQLAGNGLRFPLFDFACIWHLYKTDRLTEERLKALMPSEVWGLAFEMMNLIKQLPFAAVANALLQLLGKHLQGDYTIWAAKRGLKPEAIKHIQSMDADTELIDRLPALFAEDLNQSMGTPGAPKRVALFFDTHDAFWGDAQHRLTGDLYHQRDEWFRQLLFTLRPELGIVVAVTGRTPPQWTGSDDEDIRYAISADRLDVRPLETLPKEYAMEYLEDERVGVADPAARAFLLEFARQDPGHVHPLLLGLGADVVRTAAAAGHGFNPADFLAEGGTGKMNTLIQLLLKYADHEVAYAVKALAACRSFDYSLYRYLAQELDFQWSRPAFERLTRFSFVWPNGGRYRIHDLLRRLLRETGKDLTRQADTKLEAFYKDRARDGDEAAAVEAIYHANRCDWKRGVSEWVVAMKTAVEQSRYTFCRNLMEIRELLDVRGHWQGLTGTLAGDFHLALSRYGEALQEYSTAIAAYDQALDTSPDDPGVQNNKGNALLSLGDLQAQLSRHPKALASYAAAIAAFDQALHRAPDLVQAHNNKGNALAKRGDLQTTLSRHTEALASYTAAVTAYDQALDRAPDYINAHNNKGNALQSLGNVQATLSRHTEALASYTAAIAAYDQALDRAPDYTRAHNNKGTALQRLGDLQANLSRHTEALASYAAANAAYDQALDRAPDYINAHNNKGNALQSLGNVQATLSRHTEALASYADAIAAFNRVLDRAPDYIYAHNNKGNVLRSLGDLQATLSRHTEALASYAAALTAYDQALNRAPDDPEIHNNKGNALQSLGDLQSRFSQYPEALESYTAAIATYDQVLNRAPDDIYAHNNKGITLQSLGNLQATLSQPEVALANYAAAIEAYDQALNRAPDYVYAHHNKGNALQSLGDLQATLSLHTEALASYQAAVSAYDSALSLAPELAQARNGKANVLATIDRLTTG